MKTTQTAALILAAILMVGGLVGAFALAVTLTSPFWLIVASVNGAIVGWYGIPSVIESVTAIWMTR